MMLEELVTPPKSLGFAPDRLKLADALLEQGLQEKWYSAATYLVLRHGLLAAQGAFGRAQPDANPPVPATMETVFDLASVTKPLSATLLLRCVEDGLLTLGQTVKDFLPEGKEAPVAGVTLRQLATHTSGLPAWKPLYKTPEDSALTDILKTPLAAESGTRYTYSDLGYILLGEILARVTGKTLNELAQERIFRPLKMTQTGYLPPAAQKKRIAATAQCPWREGQILVGEVHDANAHSMGGVSAHAGIFSSAPDLARFALAFFYPTAAAHRHLPPVLGPLAHRLAARSQIDPKVGGHSIGWFTVPNGMLPRGDLLSERAFGHTGFTGTMLLFDPEHDLALILLTNRVYYPGEGGGVLRLRRLFANIVASAITA